MAATKGKDRRGLETLLRLRRSPQDPDNLVAKEELYQTKEQLAMDAAKLRKAQHDPMEGRSENQELSKAYDNRFPYAMGCRILWALGHCMASETMWEALLLTKSVEQLLRNSLHESWTDRLNASSSLCSLVDNCRYGSHSPLHLSIVNQADQL